MLPDSRPGLAREWLALAKSDLALAQIGKIPAVRYDALCFHAQQAVEKSIKAVLVFEGVDFPGTHNIRVLLDCLPLHIPVPVQALSAAELSIYAVSTRYPGNYEPATGEEYGLACDVARSLVEWAARQIR